MSSALWPWAALVLLGAYHGVNPGMGWLFAVARGLQEKSRRAVLGSLLPIAIGHEASIVMVVIAVSLTAQVVPPFFVRLLAALVLVSFGLYKLARPRSHPGGFGIRVGPAGLTMWSFLMSSAHGAGLMLAPVLLGLQVYATYHTLSEISLQAVAARHSAPGLVQSRPGLELRPDRERRGDALHRCVERLLASLGQAPKNALDRLGTQEASGALGR